MIGLEPRLEEQIAGWWAVEVVLAEGGKPVQFTSYEAAMRLISLRQAVSMGDGGGLSRLTPHPLARGC